MTPDFAPGFLSRMIAKEAAAAVERDRRVAEAYSAKNLALQIAQASPLDYSEVLNELLHIPKNMRPLLESPEGWATLAQFVAADLGVPPISYSPQVH
ncbi:MAG: hypothetical protein AAGI28_03510 [Pseudomonadota bacterium]